MAELDQTNRELLRDAILGYLAVRQGLRFTAGAIMRGLRGRNLIDFAATEQDVFTALVFLEGLRFVSRTSHPTGASIEWQVESEGVLHAERNGLA
jgi:hypothetical protein